MPGTHGEGGTGEEKVLEEAGERDSALGGTY